MKSLLPVCSGCKKIRIEEIWVRDDDLLKEHMDNITHGMCPECISDFYPQIAELVLSQVAPA